MSNRLLTTSEITNEALRILTNKLEFTKKVNRTYDDRFARSGAKIGATLNIRKPAKFRFSSGAVVDIQGLNEQYTNVTLDTQYQRALSFTSADRTLSLDMFSKRVLEPAMTSLANQIDYDGFQKSYKRAFNQVGSATNVGDKAYTTRETYNSLVGEANVTLTRFLTPSTPRSMVVDPEFMVDGATYNTSIFNPQNAIGQQYEDAALVRALGFDWYDTQNAPTHTVGTYSGTPLVNGANQSGSTLATDGWGGSTTLNIGDVFTIGGVFTVNAQTKQSTGVLQKFVVTAKNAAGATQSLQISPAIVGPEDAQNQNVSALPANDAPITVIGASEATYQLSMAMHTDAFVFACADLDVPVAVEKGARAVDPMTGLSIRYVEDYDVRNDQFITRLDLLGGWGELYPELSARVLTKRVA